MARPAATDDPGAAIPAATITGADVTGANIASFRALRASVHLEHPVWGTVWLVPDYTGAERPEISAPDLARIFAVQSNFPGSKIFRFLTQKSRVPMSPNGLGVPLPPM